MGNFSTSTEINDLIHTSVFSACCGFMEMLLYPGIFPLVCWSFLLPFMGLLSSRLVLAGLWLAAHTGRFHQDKLGDPWINLSVKKEAENRGRHQSGISKSLNRRNLISHKWMLLYFNHTEERMIYRHPCFQLLLINETCTWTETEMEAVCSQKDDPSQLW